MSFEHSVRSGTKRLRCGFTTGTCAALAAAGSAELLLGGALPGTMGLVTPGGFRVETELLDGGFDGETARCAVRKDAGDDPDVTDGVLVYAAVKKTPRGITVDGGEGIGIGWMVVARDFYPNPWVHLLLALFFPVCYMVLNLKKAAGSLEIRLSLLYVLTTWLEYALLYENGPRMYDGNFEWALCLAFAALWTSASIPFFKDWQDMDLTKTRTKIKNTFLLLTWLLHVVSGLIFFCNLLTAESLYF